MRFHLAPRSCNKRVVTVRGEDNDQTTALPSFALFSPAAFAQHRRPLGGPAAAPAAPAAPLAAPPATVEVPRPRRPALPPLERPRGTAGAPETASAAGTKTEGLNESLDQGTLG
jgi:hypothetical protein